VIYSLNRVSKVFLQRREQVPALDGVTLQVRPGEQIALLGQSGAGKTTLFRLLNGTLRPTAGSVCFDELGIGNSGNVIPSRSSKINLAQRHYVAGYVKRFFAGATRQKGCFRLDDHVLQSCDDLCTGRNRPKQPA